ncbi:hypothetical protein BN2476_740078 [Paraburkholderia piptadeniae]|uniref:Uncharacterized protein n=1 Tax=Paraburkholderia piptadeniae TaxID=1701573 RepID=A0A1N7SRF7_9BURK|nr:hypothetical protein BN2476_740078 [Paraburkholderia piptadeniae]
MWPASHMWTSTCDSGLPKLLFFYTVSAFSVLAVHTVFKAVSNQPVHLPQTPFIIAKDDSWKKARKARLD